jgi:hypothetical protein
MIVNEKSQKMIGVRMDTIELYMLKSLQAKMKAGNTSSAIRQLIRAAYSATAEQPKSKLSKQKLNLNKQSPTNLKKGELLFVTSDAHGFKIV